ncbi:hypothetical protein JKF63_06862 [Porcisia hertigi]|uniref:Cyclin 1 n=1 Tax=Porcisia hertigi TaxID=2761500 RepID=A0A836LJ97_9TRYP|nr:hypothetical protein JKF63_06862 [Porcisia hertigi]
MNSIRACLAGSGREAFKEPATIDHLISLVSTPKTGVISVAYIGTATYDLAEDQTEQTSLLVQRGCTVRPINVADPAVRGVNNSDTHFIETEADIVLVSGGNTLYAVRRWEETGLAQLLINAAARQVVLAGGSAGAICWFTSGHSDSANPATFLQPSLKIAALKAGLVPQDKIEATEAELAEISTSWSYIRVHGLNILPGMLCPHFDVTQGNGVRREVDFTQMLKRHPTERGIGVDHWALLILRGDGTYEAVALPGKTRIAGPGDTSSTTTGPAIFSLDVVDGVVQRRRMPKTGQLSDLLRMPTAPVVSDPFERFHSMENPTLSSGSLIQR